MIGKLTRTGEIDVPPGEGVYHDSLIVHEQVHAAQYQDDTFFRIKYWWNPWPFEAPAYKKQIEFLIAAGEPQSRFAWLRDIMEMNYGQTQKEVEEMLDEINFA